jgi:hypothetical protein
MNLRGISKDLERSCLPQSEQQHLSNATMKCYRYTSLLSVRAIAEDTKQEENRWKGM